MKELLIMAKSLGGGGSEVALMLTVNMSVTMMNLENTLTK